MATARAEKKFLIKYMWKTGDEYNKNIKNTTYRERTEKCLTASVQAMHFSEATFIIKGAYNQGRKAKQHFPKGCKH